MKLKYIPLFFVISVFPWFQFEDARKTNLNNFVSVHNQIQQTLITQKVNEYLADKERALDSFSTESSRGTNYWIIEDYSKVIHTKCPKVLEYEEQLKEVLHGNNQYLVIKENQDIVVFNWRKEISGNTIFILGTCIKTKVSFKLGISHPIAGQILLFSALFYGSFLISGLSEKLKVANFKNNNLKIEYTKLYASYTTLKEEQAKYESDILKLVFKSPIPILVKNNGTGEVILNAEAMSSLNDLSLFESSESIIKYNGKAFILSKATLKAFNSFYTITFALDITNKLELDSIAYERDRLFTKSSALYLKWRADGTMLYASPNISSLLEYDVIPNMNSITHKEDLSKLRTASILDVNNMEIRLLKKNGTYKWFSCCVRHSSSLYFYGLFHDITESKRLKENSVANQILYKNIYDTSFIGVLRVNYLTDKIITCNDKFSRMLGYEGKQDLIGIVPFKNLFMDDVDCEKLYSKLYNERFLYEEEVLMKNIEGKSTWVRMAMAFTDVDNEIECSCLDTNIEKDLQKRVKEGYGLFRFILNYTPSYLVCVDENNTILFCNYAFSNFFNFKNIDMIGSNLQVFVPDRDVTLPNKYKNNGIITESYNNIELLTRVIKLDILRTGKAYCFISVQKGVCYDEELLIINAPKHIDPEYLE